LTIYSNDKQLLDALQTQKSLIAGITKAQEILFEPSALIAAELTEQDGVWMAKVGL